jgi:hypothetical protein
MTLYVFDRAGACVSKPFDIAEKPRKFIRCVAGLLILDETTPGFHSPDSPESFTVTFGETEFIVERKPVFMPQFNHLVSQPRHDGAAAQRLGQE